MKIILLYGAGEVGKRNKVLEIKKQFSTDDVSIIDLDEKNLEDLEMLLCSSGLFASDKRLVVAQNAPEKLDLEKLAGANIDLTLVLTGSALKSGCVLLKSAKGAGAKIYTFEGEKEATAFPFLDNLIERKKQAFIELEKLLKEYSAMYILAMIYYLLRRNLLPLPKSGFLKNKIKTQKQKYNFNDFEKLYRLTLKVEFKIKTGTTEARLGLTNLACAFIEEKF